MRLHTEECADFNTGRPYNDFNCICQPVPLGENRLMCKPLDLNRPLRLRDCLDGERRPVEVLAKQFNLTRIRDGVLVRVVTPDGDGLGVYDVNDGGILWRNCTGLAGTAIENVPEKIKVYIYDVTSPSGGRSRSVRNNPIITTPAGTRRWQYNLLKEMEVEL